MQYYYEPGENERVANARDAFSGRLLTNPQFTEALGIVKIIKDEIKTSGTFKDKLGDYAYAYARTQKIDAMKAETILRDTFKEVTGMTMNDMRKDFVEREEKLGPEQIRSALDYAIGVGDLIEKGNKISFHRAYAHQAEQYADTLEITDAGAKRLMREEFKAAHNEELYDWGKELEKKFFTPQIEAEKEARKQQKTQAQSETQPRTRSMELRR